mgnify:CR=1 FL=1
MVEIISKLEEVDSTHEKLPRLKELIPPSKESREIHKANNVQYSFSEFHDYIFAFSWIFNFIT